MTTLQTVNIDIGKIKTRWEEPYSSQAINAMFSALPRGIYRGGQVKPGGVDNKSAIIHFSEVADLFADTMWAYHDYANGISLTIRESGEVALDLSGVTWPISGAQTWWIWGRVVYSLGAATYGAYYVTDIDPPDDAVVFAKLDMEDGDTEILSARIDASVAIQPIPSKVENTPVGGDVMLGLLHANEAWRIPSKDQKDALSGTTDPPSSSNPYLTKSDMVGGGLTPSSTWQMIWRSFGFVDDAHVTKNTTSVYIRTEGYVIIIGAYLNPSGHVISGTGFGVGDAVSFIGFIRGELCYGIKHNVTSSADLGIINLPATWSVYYDSNSAESSFHGLPVEFKNGVTINGNLTLDQALGLRGSSSQITGEDAQSILYRVLLKAVGSYEAKLVYNQGSIGILINATYDVSTGEFVSATDPLHALLFKFDFLGITVLSHANSVSPWLIGDFESIFELTYDNIMAREAKLTGTSYSYDDDEIRTFGKSCGLIIVKRESDDLGAVFFVDSGEVTKIAGNSLYTDTSGTDTKINVYNSSTGLFAIENKVGSTLDITWTRAGIPF